MTNPITAREVEVTASNAAHIANSGTPLRYMNTEWEIYFRAWRENFQRDMGIV